MRKKLPLLFTALIAFASIALAQKNELYFNINSGAFHYTGENTSYLILDTPGPLSPSTGYVSPGTKSGFCYEFSVTGQRVTKSRIIYGVDLAYQSFESKTGKFNPVNLSYSSYIGPPTSLEASLRSEFLAISPMVGYRVIDKKFRLDLKAGIEFASPIRRKQEFQSLILTTGQVMNHEGNVESKRPDNRVRFQLVGSYKRFAVNAGYSVGLTNYYSWKVERGDKVLSRLLRLGVGFRII
jgi:hypothetical protein